MAYGLLYKLPFRDLKEQDYTVEIEKNGYTGSATEITGTDAPFTITVNDEDFLYSPTRFSTAKIGIVGSDYLQSLFSTQYQMFRVTLLRGTEPIWCGFIKPETYSQDYVLSLFSYEMECVSAMSVLENLDYKQVKAGEMSSISLWNLMKTIIGRVNARYKNIYIPHVYAKDEEDYKTGSNIMESLNITEQDFFDEDGTPMNCEEVLEALCYFMNWTCVDWQGSLYFIDVDHTGDYYKYDPGMSSYEMADINNVTIQDEGFNGDGHTLDILGGYNKVVIKDSNYSVGEVFNDFDFDKSELFFDEGSHPDRRVNHGTEEYQLARTLKYSPFKAGGWTLYNYTNEGQPIKNIDNLKDYIDSVSKTTTSIGVFPTKVCVFKHLYQGPGTTNDTEFSIGSYTFDNILWMRTRNDDPVGFKFENEPAIIIKSAPFLFGYGYLCISGAVMPTYNKFVVPFENTIDVIPGGAKPYLKMSISIGDYILDPPDGRSDFRWVKQGTQKEGIIKVYTTTATDKKLNSYLNINNTFTPIMDVENLQGFAIPAPLSPIFGSIHIVLWGGIQGDGLGNPYGMCLKDFKVKYGRTAPNITKNENSDRAYENVINEDYINKLDDITFKMTSYKNGDGSGYSKVIFNERFLQDELYNIHTTNKRPEELLITRIINRYNHTSVKLTQEINYTGHIQPFTRMKDKYAPMAAKTFIPTGGEIDVAARRYKCVMIEL